MDYTKPTRRTGFAEVDNLFHKLTVISKIPENSVGGKSAGVSRVQLPSSSHLKF